MAEPGISPALASPRFRLVPAMCCVPSLSLEMKIPPQVSRLWLRNRNLNAALLEMFLCCTMRWQAAPIQHHTEMNVTAEMRRVQTWVVDDPSVNTRHGYPRRTDNVVPTVSNRVVR